MSQKTSAGQPLVGQPSSQAFTFATRCSDPAATRSVLVYMDKPCRGAAMLKGRLAYNLARRDDA